MKIQYLGYLVIGLAFFVGFRPMHPLFIPVLAAVSTMIFAAGRRGDVRRQSMSVKPSAVSDGIYLFLGQFLIVFTIYLLGYFMSTEAGGRFIDFFWRT